jgi:hypothetical protein
VNLTSSRRPLAAALLFIGAFCLYLGTASVHAPFSGDGKVMLDDAVRIATHGFAKRPGRPNSETFSRYGIGQPLLNLSVAWAYRRLVTGNPGRYPLLLVLTVAALPAALAAGTSALLLLTVCRLGYGLRAASLLGLGSALGTMLWPYAQFPLSDLTLAFTWMLALSAAAAYDENGGGGWLALAGAAAGFGVMTKVTGVLAVPWLMLPALAAIWQRQPASAGGRRLTPSHLKALTWLLTPLLAAGAVCLWYNQLRYGAPLTFGYDADRDATLGFNTPLAVGLFGLLLSSGKSFFLYNPLTFLGLLTGRQLLRQRPAFAIAVIGIAASFVVVHARWWAWSGDWAWGPRFLAGLPPLLLLLAAPCLAAQPPAREWMRSAPWRALALATLVALSVLVQVPGVFVDMTAYTRLVAAETQVFPGFYDADAWPIRDDLVHAHFIPEFSPVAGHIWMLRCILAPDDEALRRAPPWAKLNPRWIPQRGVDKYLQHNVWWLLVRAVPKRPAGMSAGAATALAMSLLLVAAAGFVGTWRLGTMASDDSATVDPTAGG